MAGKSNPGPGAFERCVKHVSERGSAYDPRAVCAAAGRRKYGKKKFAAMAKAGRKRAARAQRNPRVIAYEYDAGANKTRVRVETKQFTDWYDISGRVPQSDVLRILKPTIDRQLAQFNRARGSRKNARGPNPSAKGVKSLTRAAQIIASAKVPGLLLLNPRREHNWPWSKGKASKSDGPAFVKAGFKTGLDDQGRRASELMWVEVTSVKGGTIYGKLDNIPFFDYKSKLRLGSRVKVSKSRVLDQKNPARMNRRRNPVDEAIAAYEDFHGKEPAEVVEFETRHHFPDHTAALGDLIELQIRIPKERRRPDLKDVVTLSDFGGSWLTRHPKMKQLYIEGGDQRVNLKTFGIAGDPHEKEYLGELVRCVYFTTKEHLGSEGGTAEYDHKFGKHELTLNKTELPKVGYHVPDRELLILGGGYTIPREGIDG